LAIGIGEPAQGLTRRHQRQRARSASGAGRTASFLVFLLAGLVCLPVAAVVWIAIEGGSGAHWLHLWQTVLPLYVRNTLLLAAGVAAGALSIGVTTAWLVTLHEFPARRLLEWALLLPLAMPAYVVAFVYTDLLDYGGAVQTGLRALFGWQGPQDYWFPEVRSLPGAVAVLSAALYPYVYLLTRSALLEQSATLQEAARTLGQTPRRAFFRVVLPLAWPSIMVGVMLALMETVGDFGVVDFFAVQTLTTGLYNVWLVMGDRAGAGQVALVLLAFIAVIVVMERRARRRRAYFAATGGQRPPERRKLSPAKAALAFVACLAPLFVGFLLPAGLLGINVIETAETVVTPDFLAMAGRSLMLALAAALLTVACAIGIAYALRLGVARTSRTLVRAMTFGYAVPGPVLALGVLIPFAAADRAINGVSGELFGISTGLLLSGTVATLLFAYLVRFFAVSFGAVDSGLERVRPSLDMAARTLGRGRFGVLREVHLPVMRASVATALILVFVDVMKELPATLLLRPFNFETLATEAYSLASDELLEQAAVPSLAIVLAGLIPVILLSRTMGRERRGVLPADISGAAE